MGKSRKSIAVIFFGQPRFVETKLASVSHKWWLRGADVEYFGHCWFGGEDSTYETAPWANLGEISIDSMAIKKIRLQYPNIILSIDKPQTFNITDYKKRLQIKSNEEVSEVFSREIGNLSNLASQFLSMHRALETFEQNSNNANFDLVVLTRFDNLIWKMKRPIYFLPNKLTLSNHHGGFPDLIYAGNYEILKALDIWPEFEKIISGERNLSAEHLKKKGFLRRYTLDDLNPVHSDITILRSNELKYILWTLPSMRIRRILQIKTRLKKAHLLPRSS